jgi:hypothetical protein
MSGKKDRREIGLMVVPHPEVRELYYIGLKNQNQEARRHTSTRLVPDFKRVPTLRISQYLEGL